MTNKPRAVGTRCESAVVAFLRDNGFPHAERAALAGSADSGDITGVVGVCVEVKGGAVAERAEDADVTRWLAETERERVNRGSDVALLVLKRRGKGMASAGAWWVYLPGWTFCYLAHPSLGAVHCAIVWADLPTVRLTLAEAVRLLRRCGFGSPLSNEEAA